MAKDENQARVQRFDNAARQVALYITGDDKNCTATKVGEWPYAAKRTIIQLARADTFLADLVKDAPP